MLGILSFLFGCRQTEENTYTFQEVDYSPTATTFTLFAPDTATVVLRLYDSGTIAQPTKLITLEKTGTNLFSTTVDGDLQGLFYTFDIGLGETPGVFATAVNVNGTRGAIIDMRSTDPDGWDTEHDSLSQKSPCDRIIYELHHRDFSIDPSSGITNKGKFLALTEAPAIAHLKALGINTVHLLPSFDFATIDETRLDSAQYNWGYDPLNYNVPEGSYSTDPYDPATRIREFKQMVMALHQADIDVVLDVVYNHTNDIVGSNFQRTFPDYFYRKTAAGDYSNGSGCGNETASDQPAMRDFMLASMAHWMDEYHIDGFRVDLMGVHDIETMNYIASELESRFGAVFIYGEGWSAGPCAYDSADLAMKANIYWMPNIAAFSDELRDGLRGPFSDDTQGAFLAGLPGEEESVKYGLVGAIDHPQIDFDLVNYADSAWANEPSQMVAYVSCHDDMCLVDRLRASIPDLTDDELIRLDLLAQTAVLTSQGIPFLLCGEEMLRTKQGVHNSYNSPDDINHLEWGNLQRYPQVFSYYAQLIAMRKAHRAFRLGTAELVRDNVTFLPTTDNVIAFTINGTAVDDPWHTVIVALNATRDEQTIAIPNGTYTVVCRDGTINLDGINTLSGTSVTIPRQSAIILHD